MKELNQSSRNFLCYLFSNPRVPPKTVTWKLTVPPPNSPSVLSPGKYKLSQLSLTFTYFPSRLIRCSSLSSGPHGCLGQNPPSLGMPEFQSLSALSELRQHALDSLHLRACIFSITTNLHSSLTLLSWESHILPHPLTSLWHSSNKVPLTSEKIQSPFWDNVH